MSKQKGLYTTISLFLAIVISALSASNAKPCLGAAAQLGIALWNNEFFITDESEAYIEVQDNSGGWKKVCNLISEMQSGQLKAKINGFSRKQFTNQNGMFGMRITNNSEAIGDRNLNRLSIDQFVFADTYGERLLYDNY